MKLPKIHSIIGLNELFSFIKEELKFKSIENNKYYNQRLNILFNIKRNFCREKIKYYDFNGINEYFTQFKDDLKNIIKEKEINELFFYALSKKENFHLKLSDKDFNLLINNNSYFENNLRIEIDDLTKEILPRYLLIKENKLTDKTLIILKEIFDIFSINGKMDITQINEFITNTFKNIEEKKINFEFIFILSFN